MEPLHLPCFSCQAMDVLIFFSSFVIFFIKSVTADEYCPSATTSKKGFWCRGEDIYCCATTGRSLQELGRYCCCDCTRSLSFASRGRCTSTRKDDPSCPENLTETVAGIIGGVVITLLILFTFAYICCRKHGFARATAMSRKNSSRVNPLRPATRDQQGPGGLAGDAEQRTISPPPYTVDPPVIQPPPYRPRTPRDLLTSSRDILSPPPPYSFGIGIDPGYPPVEGPIPSYGSSYLTQFPLTPGYPASGTQREGPVTRSQTWMTSRVSFTNTLNVSRGAVQGADSDLAANPPVEDTYILSDRMAGTEGHAMDLMPRDCQANTITKY